MILTNYLSEGTNSNTIEANFNTRYQKYCNDLLLIKKYAKTDYEKSLSLIEEYYTSFLNYQKRIKEIVHKRNILKQEKDVFIKEANEFLLFERKHCLKLNEYLENILNDIHKKYELFIEFDKQYEQLDNIIGKIYRYSNVEIKELLILKQIKNTITEILNKQNSEDNYKLICETIIKYNLKRLDFDKVVQHSKYKIKFPKKNFNEINIKNEFDIFNLNNYTLTKKELDHIIQLNSFNYKNKINDINDFKKQKKAILLDKYFINDFGYIRKSLKKYETLSIEPKLKLQEDCPYQIIVFDSNKEQIKNSLEENILNNIKENKEKYLKIFNDNLIKLFNIKKEYDIEDIITINNHFISLYIKGENSYNHYLILSSLLTILNTYQYNENLKDELNYAHTYLIKYKKETTALIIYLFSQINLENLKNYNDYNQIFNIIKSIITENSDKDYLYLLTTKLEELATCLKQSKINEDLLFNNNYYPFDKVNTKNIQLEFELNMQPFYQEYVKTKVKSPII